MKKILVTGATGFIGNYVVKELLHRKYPVIATSSSEVKAKNYPWLEKVKYIELDLKKIDNKENYYQFFDQPDLMIHLAWEGLPNYKNSFHIKENLPRHFNLLKNLIKNGLQDITVTGTCFEYGKKDGCLSEDMNSEPDNAYAIAKDNLRKKIKELSGKNNLYFKWIRLFYTYGKGQSPNSLISQLEKALTAHEPVFNMSGGEQERDFLPVKKVAEYIVSIALQNEVTDIINCCSGKPVTVKHFVEEFLREKNKTIKLNLGYYPYTDYEAMKFWGDTKKLNHII